MGVVIGGYDEVIRDKIVQSTATLSTPRVARHVALPALRGKAIAVIGMRRVGKTEYLQQCRAEQLAAGCTPEALVYLNFEDERLEGFTAADLGQIPDLHVRMFPSVANTKVTFYWDEVQLIEGWETVVRRLLDSGFEFVLSGSSAKLLSREIATSMRGRGWEIAMYPFGFDEHMRFRVLTQSEFTPDWPLANLAAVGSRKSALIDRAFSDYLAIGGFPEAQNLPREDRRTLLQGYVDAVMLRDVVERHKVTNPTALRWLIRRLLSSPGGLFSVTGFAADLKSQALRVGRELLYEYLDHIEDAFLVHTIPVATDSEKRRQVNPRKAYPADTGLIPVFDRSGKSNIGHALEVAVFTELKRRGAEVAYVKTTEGTAVDFLARNRDGSESLLQVCTSIDNPEVKAREVRALVAAAKEHPRAERLILTLESRTPFPATPKGIRVLPAWRWILEGPPVSHRSA
jgi:uncharacterized protein